MKKWLLPLFALGWSLLPQAASAQLDRGDFRLSLDVDVISVAHVTVDPDGVPGERETLVFGIGPNQLGGSRATMASTPLGLGFGWVLTRKIILGLRTGLGFDVIDAEGSDNNVRVLAFSLMPGVEFVPIGQRAKLFIALRPLFQVNRVKIRDDATRMLLGGFSTGIGTYIFPSPSVSADIGFFFEGRFGNMKDEDADTESDVMDLRGLIRFGLSLWR